MLLKAADSSVAGNSSEQSMCTFTKMKHDTHESKM